MEKKIKEGSKGEKKVIDVTCASYFDENFVVQKTSVPKEKEVKLSVNGIELVNILCTPAKLDFLVYGYLYLEGIISKIDDVREIKWSEDGKEVQVTVSKDGSIPSEGRTIPVGLGGGAIFKRDEKRVDSKLRVSANDLIGLISKFNHYLESERNAGGIHTSALANSKELLMIADDIGRHNTIDKLAGEALLQKLETKDKILLTTGRISSEMIFKGARLGVPIVVTRRSPTDGAIRYAKEIGITLVGHAKKDGFYIFSHAERVGFYGKPLD